MSEEQAAEPPAVGATTTEQPEGQPAEVSAESADAVDAGANEDVDGDGAADETKWPSEAWNGDGEGSPLDPGCALALNDDDMDRRPRVF